MTVADFGITGRTVVITGASRGVGALLAEGFANHGAHLGLLARDVKALEAVSDTLPVETLPVCCDVTDERAVNDALQQVRKHFGSVDSVIANSGMAPVSRRAHQLDTAAWKRAVDVNLTGSFITAKCAYEHLVESGRGRLVLTSSAMARAPRPGISAYAASKAGIEGLTRALAVDWASSDISVNAVAPGFLDLGLGTPFADSDRLRTQVTSRTPMQRVGRGEELVNVVLFLAGSAASYLTGQVVAVDGGYGLG